MSASSARARFTSRIDRWLPFPGTWPGATFGGSLELADVVSLWFFPGGAQHKRATGWADACAEAIDLLPDADELRYLWLGEPNLPPTVLRIAQFGATGDASVTLRIVAGLAGSIPDAAEAHLTDAPHWAAAAVCSERTRPGRPRRGFRAAVPGELQARWALRAKDGPDLLVTLSTPGGDAYAQARADAVRHLETLVLLTPEAAEARDVEAEDSSEEWVDDLRRRRAQGV